MKFFRLYRAKHLLKQIHHQFRKKKHRLNEEDRNHFHLDLCELQKSILDKDDQKAAELSKKLAKLAKEKLKKNALDHLTEFVIALVIAIIIAVVIRQMWFEFYEIPTGSMRPTLREKDRLVVSKTQFGLNIPLTKKHFYFDPDDVKRSGVVVFTGEGMDIRDLDTKYFYIFPGKKQFVKRMIGKPEDTLYFYGGNIYGVDKDGRDISHELNPKILENIDHVPFIQFEGKVITPMPPLGGIYSPVILYQMNMPVAKMYLSPFHQIDSEILYRPVGLQGLTPKYPYFDLWGFKNYGMVRLLTKEQVISSGDFNPESFIPAELYLEISHHPNLKTAKLQRDPFNRERPIIGIEKSYFPLNESHLKAIFDHLYTARFIVQKGYAHRIGTPAPNTQTRHIYPYLPGIPDGTYEFYHGQAYEVKWQGILKKLPKTHPLAQFDAQRLKTLFNVGIEFDLRYAPENPNFTLMPSRYVYFRNKDLYLMGAPVIKHGDPELTRFIHDEYIKQSHSSTRHPYYAYDDYGPPILSTGKLNTQFIKKYGVTVPEGHYLVLGDNYAMSADSRDFGFVPQENLRGVPDWIFWPPGSRFGSILQPHYPIFTLPRMIVWLIALIVFGIWGTIHYKRHRFPFKIL